MDDKIKPLSSTTIWGRLAPRILPSTSSLRMGMSVSAFMSPDRHIPRLAFAPEPAELPIKPDQGDQKNISMDAFVSTSCPSLYQPYDPPRWMHKYVVWLFPNSYVTIRISLAVVTSKPHTAWSEISPKSTRLYITGKSGTMVHLQPTLTPMHRKLLRTVDGGTLYVLWLNPQSHDLISVSFSEVLISRLPMMRISQIMLQLSS